MPISRTSASATGKDLNLPSMAADIRPTNTQEKNPAQNADGKFDQFAHLIDSCQDGILLTSKKRIVYANPSAIDLLACPESNCLLGRTIDEFLSPDHSLDQARTAKSADGIVVGDEYPVVRKLRGLDGVIMNAEIIAVPCLDAEQMQTMVIFRDFGKRQSAAAGLKRPDEYLQVAVDAVLAPIAYVDSNQRYRFANAAHETWFGCAKNDLPGRTVSEVMGTAYADLHPHIAKALTGERTHHELTVPTQNGIRHLSICYEPDTALDGIVRGFSCMMMDVTSLKHEEHVLREQKKQLRLITDALPVLIAQCDRNYTLRFVNKSYAERFGFRPEDTIGKRIPDIVGAEAFSLFRNYLDAALAGNAQEHEIEMPLRNFGDQYMHMMYVPECDDLGHVQGLIVAISDITQLRRTEEKLHRREQEFKTLVENSPDGISRIDRSMRHIYVNPAMEAITGLHSADYLGKTKSELGLPSDIVCAWDSAVRAAFETGTEQCFDFELMNDAVRRYFSARVLPESDRGGHIESVLGITYDVTERTKMEKEHEVLLARERNARIQAETAARARDEFLAIVSHELRAPLNGIQSWAHILENYVKESNSAPLAQRAIKGIKTGVAQQVRLIEDLLDVTRMMSGKLRLVKQAFALLPVIQAAVESIRSIAEAKQIGITCTYLITTEQIDGDADRIQQIIWNLLTNAVKFTPQGGNIWLSAACMDDRIIITVRDDGIGISPDFLPHLFDRFSQKDTSSTRGYSGLGLGLFLVRHLLELHGGSIEVDSAGEGMGATFSVTLPLRVSQDRYISALQDTGDSAGSLPSLKGLRVLLIDDQEEARESLTMVLASAGASVFSAGSSREVFDWLPTIDAKSLPDILICDIAMPIEDGYSVLRRLRAWETDVGSAPLHRLPALALTAFAQREDRIRALTAGFQMHMTKPVAPEELIVVIAMVTSRG